ncbi:hypothetical protein ACSBR1_025699 [Camellia fascicularis]
MGLPMLGNVLKEGLMNFREVLCKYVVEHGFQFKYVKNDSIRITVVCKFAASMGCTWLVHTRVLSAKGILRVKSFDSVHTCGTAVKTHRNLRTGSEVVSSVVVDWVRDQPLTRPTDVLFDLKNEYGLEISYRVAWLGVEKDRSEVYGDHAMSFDQLRWYSDSVMEKNPHSYINLEFDQITRMFVRWIPSLSDFVVFGWDVLKGQVQGQFACRYCKGRQSRSGFMAFERNCWCQADINVLF